MFHKLVRPGLIIGAMASALVALSAAAEEAAAPSVERGKETFALYCASCHGEGGQGGFGPALNNLADRKDKRDLVMIIKEPASPMPPLYPATISDQDLADIVGYLQSLQTH